MRKFLSAGVLTAAAAVALLPVFSAQASPLQDDHEPEWTLVEDYFHLVDCRDAGEAGQDADEWDRYRCEFQTIPGDWNLYVIDDDNGDNGDSSDNGDDDDVDGD